ncbi:hypothetical protein [Phaeobacter sp.]|uniref:hypothetical protein n=1 Tax=Phaeobacter sp. TaxID=1902409 RepID=UPI0025D2A4F3|nr:hypothetical protein [Phaeobacter sp.]
MADKKQSEESSVQDTQAENAPADIDTSIANAEDDVSAPEQQEQASDQDTLSDAKATDTSAEHSDPQDDPAVAEETVSDPGSDTDQDVASTVAPGPATPPQTERVIERRGGFFTAFLGGLVAAGFGFVAGQSTLLDGVLPSALRSAPTVDLQTFEAAQDQFQSKLAELESRLADQTPSSLSSLEERIDAVEGAVNDLPSGGSDAPGVEVTDRLQALSARLDALESRPTVPGADPEAIAAFEAELAKLQDGFAAQRAEVEQMLADAQQLEQASAEAARVAAAQTALARLRASVDLGQGFAAIATELEQLGVSVPNAVSGAAESGVSTLAALQDGFAPAARSALSLARTNNTETASLADYVRRQLGARSVAPKDGDDPDAILSRAEAAVKSGDLRLALDELSAFPESARAPLADWESAAQARLAAVLAVDELAQSLNAK